MVYHKILYSVPEQDKILCWVKGAIQYIVVDNCAKICYNIYMIKNNSILFIIMLLDN